MRVLSFDIEAWFHILDLEGVASPEDWQGRPTRLMEGVDRILDVLAETNQKATFFVLGWVAEHHPEVVRKIDSLGYEIGTHSHEHQLVYGMTPQSFAEDLDRSMKALSDVTGKPIRIYRAPGFSITDDCLWAFDMLAERGIQVDCSLFSAPRNHGGVRGISADTPCIVQSKAGALRELPMNTASFAGRRFVFSGGGFFRLLPYPAIKGLTKRSDYTMTYFHPRDFDAGQPRLEMSAARKFRSYVGIEGAMNKLRAYLNDFDFVDVAEAERRVDWDRVQTIAV